MVPWAFGVLSAPAVHKTSMLVGSNPAVSATEPMVGAVALTVAGHVVDVMVGNPASWFNVTVLFSEQTALPSQFFAIA